MGIPVCIVKGRIGFVYTIDSDVFELLGTNVRLKAITKSVKIL